MGSSICLGFGEGLLAVSEMVMTSYGESTPAQEGDVYHMVRQEAKTNNSNNNKTPPQTNKQINKIPTKQGRGQALSFITICSPVDEN